jgi:transcriptional regulator with XRE-family HTH domain
VQADISKRFRERIRALRIQRCLTQEEAAEICGIGQKLYQLYELGIKDNPGLKTLQKISQAFGLEVWQLLGPSTPRIGKAKPKRKKILKRLPRNGVRV